MPFRAQLRLQDQRRMPNATRTKFPGPPRQVLLAAAGLFAALTGLIHTAIIGLAVTFTCLVAHGLSSSNSILSASALS